MQQCSTPESFLTACLFIIFTVIFKMDFVCFLRSFLRDQDNILSELKKVEMVCTICKVTSHYLIHYIFAFFSVWGMIFSFVSRYNEAQINKVYGCVRNVKHKELYPCNSHYFVLSIFKRYWEHLCHNPLWLRQGNRARNLPFVSFTLERPPILIS